MAVFSKSPGRNDSTFQGSDGIYDQVDYYGVVEDYTFSRNDDGSVTVYHPDFGTDTLVSIEGFWFIGSNSWISIDDVLAQSDPAPTPTPDPVPPSSDPFLAGTDADDTMVGSNVDNVFLGDGGDDFIDGNGGAYNQANYFGSIYDVTMTQNADGSITVVGADSGTDTLVDIDGFWFGGEAEWYSVADALALVGTTDPITDPDPDPDPNPPSDDPLQIGTAGNDNMVGSNMDNIFFGDAGDDVIDGNGGFYNQANYFGSIDDVTMTQNADGSITVTGANSGTDTLTDIDGFWFEGEMMWYTTADALAIAGDDDTDPVDPVDPIPTDPSGGVFIDGVYTGTSGVDTLIGGEGPITFDAGMGVGDTVIGNNENDTLNVEGGVVEWTFFNNADGSVTMTHPTWGSNIMTGIDSILFGRTGQTLSVADAIAATAGLPAFRLDDDGVVNGTPFDDVMIGTEGFDNYYGGVGDDTYDGGADFDQVNYDGLRSDYTIVDNGDGSITISHDVFGTDTITNIEGLFFNGGANDIPVDGITVGEPEFILVADLFGAA